MRFYILIVIFGVDFLDSLMQCSQTYTADPNYYLIGKCFKSEVTVIAHGYQRDLEKCRAFAVQKRGLAFNFKDSHKSTSVKDFDEDFTCQVLDCPENDNFTNLEPSGSYDYYSFYADPVPNMNYTCISGIGVFYYHSKRENYTEATRICQENYGDLAHILTDSRTSGISNLLKLFFTGHDTHRQMAYVGLRDLNNTGVFETPLGEPLSCYPYRAWAPANPKPIGRNYSCVAIDVNKMWHAVKCNKKLPFLCELYPFGPWNEDNDFNVTLPDTNCKDSIHSIEN